MADSFIQLPADSTGKMVRAFSGTVSTNTVYEQAFVLCDSSMNVVGVLTSAPTGSESGLVVRNIPSGTQAVSGTVTAQQATAASLNATVTQQAITKGTQGSTGVTTQDLKDSGRTYVCLSLDRVTGVTTEALATMSINRGGTVTTAASYTVTTGKTLRIQAMNATVLDTTTTAASGRVRLRAAATVSATSGILVPLDIGNFPGTAAAGLGATADYSFPDGIEVAAGQQVGISQLMSSTSSTVTVSVVGFEY